MYKPLNKNPVARRTTDCTIRALAKIFNTDWLTIFDEIAMEARRQYDMMDANNVWINWLYKQGFELYGILNTCPNCYTIRDFCIDHPTGSYIVGTGTHAVAVVNGDWYDTFNSGDLVPLFYLRRRDDGI